MTETKLERLTRVEVSLYPVPNCPKHPFSDYIFIMNFAGKDKEKYQKKFMTF